MCAAFAVVVVLAVLVPEAKHQSHAFFQAAEAVVNCLHLLDAFL